MANLFQVHFVCEVNSFVEIVRSSRARDDRVWPGISERGSIEFQDRVVPYVDMLLCVNKAELAVFGDSGLSATNAQ